MTVGTIAAGNRESKLPVVNDFEQIVEMVEDHETLYVRYSEGPDVDQEGPSRDYESGMILPGLSATSLNPPYWWSMPSREWIARRICKYGELMRGLRQPRPWLLNGREVGSGPDHEPLLVECRPIAWVGPTALAEAAEVYQQRFVVGQDSRSLLPRSLSFKPVAPVDPMNHRCPYCFPASITPNQLLVTTEHFHVLALAQPHAEGLLGIMTHACQDGPTRLRCIDDISTQWVDELSALCKLVVSFYRDMYGTAAMLYEHGRGGGGGAATLPGGDYVTHPIVYALPVELQVHDALRARFAQRPSVRVSAIRTVIGRRPYVYVHTPDDSRYPMPAAYYAADGNDHVIRGLSLERLLGDLDAIDIGASRELTPGEGEIEKLVTQFTSWYTGTFLTHPASHISTAQE